MCTEEPELIPFHLLRDEPAPRCASPDFLVEKDALREDVRTILKTLSPKEEFILKMYFGLGGLPSRTQAEIGRLLGFTHTRVYQIKRKAIGKLLHTTWSAVVAQLVGHLASNQKIAGSRPVCCIRGLRPPPRRGRLSVRTSGFQPGKRGSIPRRGIDKGG